jgi:anti-sigma regulatory factor (Ser/Thr protein kinase)
MAEIKLQTGTRVFEVLAYLCHSPMEALKQFVENGADAVEQAGKSDGCIRVRLDHSSDQQNRPPQIVVEDNGIGIGSEKMSHILQNIGNSEKLQHVLRGEKGVGILAFALIADELHLSSLNGGHTPSCLVLRREWLGEGRAQIIEQCPQHRLSKPGTRAHLIGILPEIAPQLTKGRLKQYLSREFANDLRRNIYTIQISDGHGYDAVEPRIFNGVPTLSTNISLSSLGNASIQLYTLPFEAEGANIDLCGRAGIRFCSLTDVEEFKKEPWLGQRLEGSVRCDKFRGTADKAAVVQDEVYKALAEALHRLEPEIAEKIRQVTQEYRQNRLVEIMSRVDRFIGYFLRYKETGELPRRKIVAGDGITPDLVQRIDLPAVRPDTRVPVSSRPPRSNQLSFLQADLCMPPEGRSQLRTWSDNGGNAVKINVLHTDFLSSERDDKRCAWYLFSVWAKQQLLKECGTDAEALADEMVGLFSRAGPLLNQFAIRPRSPGRNVEVVKS